MGGSMVDRTDDGTSLSNRGTIIIMNLMLCNVL